MTRSFTLVAASAIIALTASAAHCEPAYQDLPGADFAPGKLKLPLTVHERSGVARRGAVVTSGVPFVPGFLPDASRLAVIDKDGRPVVCQAAPMIRWHKPAWDDSVQWALVSFAADVPANGTATYYLTDDGKSAAPASPLKVSRSKGAITIDTGAATFVVPLRGEALLASATIGGRNVLGPSGLRGTIVSGDWADRGLKAGAAHASTHEPDGVTVEESGPARVVVAIRGGFAPGDRDGKLYDFTARIYFEAASPSIRIVYTLRNGRLDPGFYPVPGTNNKARMSYIWPIQGASLVADLDLGDNLVVSTTADGKRLSERGDRAQFVIRQSRPEKGTVFVPRNSPAPPDSPPGGYDVLLGDKVLAHGDRHPGVLDASNRDLGVTVARRYFWEEWPGTLAVRGKTLAIDLFPEQTGQTFHLNKGQRKSWDIRLTLHGGDAADLGAARDEQDALLLFRVEPAWMVRAGGLTGAWSAGIGLTKPPARLAARRDDRIFQRSNGWDRFGVIGAWNAGGGHWNEQTAFRGWALHGDGAEFDNAEVYTLWAADHCPIMLDQPNMWTFFPYVSHGNTDHVRMKVLSYPGYVNRDGWGRPDSGHMGMWMWVEYYLLTGDARAREAVCHLGDMARAHLWRYTHDDPKDGSGPTGYPFPDYGQRDPDADADFKLDRRYVGWPLYCLAQYYQFTGQPELLDEARIIARSFRNTARACPIGQMVRDAAGKDGTEPTEYSANITRGNDGTASQVRESKRAASLVSSNFYSGIMIYGLREYYLVSRDVEALDTLVGQIDRFCHHSLIRNPQGAPAGWSYIFADYWGPYTWEDSIHPRTGKAAAGFTSSNGLVCDAIARIYPLTGRADLMAVLAPAQKANGNGVATAALAMTTAHPKVDRTPPAAIADLAAEALGGGKVRLTWTAPGGDGAEGRAAWYQVKWTAARLVERVEGWPDRTDPLPGTRLEWLDRSAAFNAKQRSFWAANNVSGEPEPGPAGTKQSMVVENLPAGPANLAIKSWDDADNISPLSNVVAVTVK